MTTVVCAIGGLVAESFVFAALSSKLFVRASSQNRQLTRPGLKTPEAVLGSVENNKNQQRRKGLPKRLERNHQIFRVEAYIGTELI